MKPWSQQEASRVRYDLLHRLPAEKYRSFGIFSVGVVLLQQNPEAWGVKYTLFEGGTSDDLRSEFLPEEQDNIVVGTMELPHQRIEPHALSRLVGALATAGRVG